MPANEVQTEVRAQPGTDYRVGPLRALAASTNYDNTARSLPADVPTDVAADVVDWLAGRLHERGDATTAQDLHALADAMRGESWWRDL